MILIYYIVHNCNPKGARPCHNHLLDGMDTIPTASLNAVVAAFDGYTFTELHNAHEMYHLYCTYDIILYCWIQLQLISYHSVSLNAIAIKFYWHSQP